MSEQVRVEQEIVQPKADSSQTVQPVVDASGTTLFDLVAEWISTQVIAQVDPRAMSPRFEDYVAAMDELIFGYLLSDEVRAGDALLFDVAAKLSDAIHAADPMRFDHLFGLADAVSAGDAIRLTTEMLLADALSASDIMILAWVMPLSDTVNVDANLTTHQHTPLSDTAMASDSGVIIQSNYVALGYVDDSYVGTVSTF